jgi:hypothetical protein
MIMTRGIIRGQSSDIIIAGKPVEISVATLSPSTVRLTMLPIADGRATALPVDTALVSEGEGRALAHSRERDRLAPVRAGNLVVRFTAEPPTLHADYLSLSARRQLLCALRR